jgi:hypothetical protein
MFWTTESFLPLFDIELKFLAVPACSPVTVLRLPQLNSSNGRTAWIFQILLTAQGSSGWRQQQLLTVVLFRFWNEALENSSEETGHKNVRIFLLNFCLRLNSK